MREGWTYKKIGDLCNIKTGKLDANAANENGMYPFFTCSKEPMSINTYAYDCECVLIAGNGDLNVKYYNGKFNAYQRTYILSLKEEILGVSMPYIYNFFLLYVNELRRKSIGGIIKYIKLGDLTNANIPIPSLSEQKSIVAELDKINELISLKKAQLSDLDNLAQSIFYDMFGDPIENEKGWEYLKLQTLIDNNIIIYHLDGNHGGDYPRSEEFVDRGVPYIGANCLNDGSVDFSLAKYLPKEKADKLRKGLAKNGDVLFAHNATVGPVAFLNTKEPLVILSTSLTAFRCNLEKMHPLFLRSYMQSTWFESQYKSAMKQTTRNQIPITKQKNMFFICPPLTLQQDFAKRIELIEQQKAQISSTIKDLETLLASRMQYWFD